MAADVAVAVAAPALVPKIHVSHFGQDISFTSREMFQSWANDYISFITNSGASVAYINIGDFMQDTKNAYAYLVGVNNNEVPWIVTDFLDKLPAGVDAGVIAYLDVGNAWTLYQHDNPSSNVTTTDGKSTSPPKNNAYQAFQLVNAINAAQLQSGGTKFITHFQADGEGAGAFEGDSYYGFGPTPDKNTPYDASQNKALPDPTWRTTADWPTAGYGYLKWLWNHFMPGVTAAEVAPGGVALPASATMPDVVFSDQEAVDPTTWSTGQQDPYRFGIIKYAQTSWLNYSPGPMLAYTENYWFGENHYMPGPGSAIAPDLKATINNVQMPVLNPPPPASNNIPSGQTTVTFNQPVDANGAAIGTAAQGYAIMGQGSIDLTAMGNYTKAFFGGSGIGAGYSSGAWVTNGGSGYTSADVGGPHNLNVIFTPQAGDTPGRPAKGYIDTVSQGQVVSITITDPGHGYTKEPLISFPTTLAGTGAEAVALVLESDGYPTLTFHATGTKQAHGFVTVGSQGYKPGSITGVTIFDPGRGYAYTPIDTTAANPLAGPDGLKITFSSTTAPPQYLPQILHKAGVPAAQAAPPLFVPVNSSPQMVDQIVITVLGDHYDTGRNKPYYTLGGDPSNTKHYLAGGVAKNGVAPTYNAAYVPALNAVGAFVVDDSGIAQITVINPGSGYPAGAIITSGGAGYDNSTTYNITFPAPLGGGRAARGFLQVNADGNAIGITITDPGEGYTAADDDATVPLPTPTGVNTSAATAKAYLANYPTVTLAGGTFRAGGGTAAEAFVITGPVDPKNPGQSNPANGYIVTGIGFAYPGVGYETAPTMTVSKPAGTDGVTAIVQALPALASKYSAAQLPTIKDVLGAPQSMIHGGANAYNWQVSNGNGPGQVIGVTIDAPGSGYTSAPTVTFSAPPTGGATATGTAVVSSGTITGITITNPGYGYDPRTPPTVSIAPPPAGGTPASAHVGTLQLGDVTIMSKAAVNTVYDFYKDQPQLLAAMFNQQLYQDVALPKLREAFYWPLQWSSFLQPNFTDGTKTGQNAIATFSIESLNRSNAFDADGNYIPGQVVRTSLDSKYQTDDALKAPNTLGGTFAGLSSLTYEDFVEFLNAAAQIIADNAPKNADGTPTMRPQDVTFQVYDAAFLPIEWLPAQNANRWGDVNEAPVIVSGESGSVPENAPASRIIYTAAATDIGATRADRTLTYAIKPGLADDGALVSIDPRYGEVRLRASANFEAKSSYAFTVVVSDGGSPALSVERDVRVDVVDLFESPSAPQIAPPVAISVLEDTPTKLICPTPPFSDADSPATRRITVDLQVADGRLQAAPALGVVVTGSGSSRSFTGTVGALNAYFTDPHGRITYVPSLHANGTDRLVIRATEGSGSGRLVSAATTELRRVAVNDAPRLRTTAAPLVVREGRPMPLPWAAAARAVSDVDSPLVSVVMTVSAGTIHASPAAGVAVMGSLSESVEFSGSPAALSSYFATLGRVRYTSPRGGVGPQVLTLTADDGIDSRTVTRTIRVLPLPQPPSIAALAAFQATAGGNTPLVFQAAPFADPSAGHRLTATLTIAEGSLAARSAAGVEVGGTPRARTFTGSLAALNAYFTDPVGRITLRNPAAGTRPLGVVLVKPLDAAHGPSKTLAASAWTTIDVA